MPADTVFNGFRVSFAWTQQGDRIAGWTENFWIGVTDRTVAIASANALATLLQFAKGDQTYCPRFRLSIPGVFRSGKTYPRVGAGPRNTQNNPSDYQVTKWLLQMVGTSGTTQQWFGGVVDASIVSGGFLNQGVVGGTGILTAIAALTNSANVWSVNVLNPATLPIPILSIDPQTGTVTTGGHTYVTGNRVRVQFVKGLTYANNIWKVIQIAGNTTQFVLAGWAPQPLPFLNSPNATVRQQNYIGQQIKQVNVIRASNHRVGRPTGQFGGRRKKKKIV